MRIKNREQQTFNVDGHKITVKATRNVHGFRVLAKDNRGNRDSRCFMTLDIDVAIERGYVNFVQRFV
jgi:hypothetical protein